MSDGGNSVPRITKAEHIGPQDTGDNIEAKRTANYYWDQTSGSWMRMAAGLVPGSYDYIAPSFASTTDTYVFKTGGSSGTTVATVTLTYTDTTKATLQSVART